MNHFECGKNSELLQSHQQHFTVLHMTLCFLHDRQSCVKSCRVYLATYFLHSIQIKRHYLAVHWIIYNFTLLKWVYCQYISSSFWLWVKKNCITVLLIAWIFLGHLTDLSCHNLFTVLCIFKFYSHGIWFMLFDDNKFLLIQLWNCTII